MANIGNDPSAVFMQFYWSVVEIGDSSLFSNNSDYDILIQLIDSTINYMDNTQFDYNDNINYGIDFGSDLEIGVYGHQFCALTLDIDGNLSVINNVLYILQM